MYNDCLFSGKDYSWTQISVQSSCVGVYLRGGLGRHQFMATRTKIFSLSARMRLTYPLLRISFTRCKATY
ncbi:hypothetical protein M378DRAFT_310672 [Amanita muscaria Koide BX008]|uniref:Uncharacterized protein n=1 Tax=Amanita muscaria (strain Koide BX008) TaxID=946122 RepID=A0A0C2S792_AMAMK|nr:hypothetical protein M378DRAFT_310672 [Amanita muscaria Koide BX008]